MGDPKTPRYKILIALNKHRALGYNDLLRKSHISHRTLYDNLKRLINERIINRWDFGGKNILYSHCFIPWYEVKEIYERKYRTRGNSRDTWRTEERRKLEKVFKS